MNASHVPIVSLTPIVDKVIQHLREQRDTALVSLPGCGSTTLTQTIKKELIKLNLDSIEIDLRIKSISDSIRQLNSAFSTQVVIIDHAAYLPQEELKIWIQHITKQILQTKQTCLWIGHLDSRKISEELDIRIHAIPKSHITFPVLPRDEILAVYRFIANKNDCRWGEALLFLLLDFCGNDFSLVRGLTEYLYGNWTDKLYDVNIWDRINEWFLNDEVIRRYRQCLSELPESCKRFLKLIRLGGKPICKRAEVYEEIDSSLRQLCLQGILMPNYLPGYYQIRNLTIRYLVLEQYKPWDNYSPEILFRRMTSERVTAILQDVEMMIRSVLLGIFQYLGEKEVSCILQSMQAEGEVISKKLNKALLEWAEKDNSPELKRQLNELIITHRNDFKIENSLWEKVNRIMKGGKENRLNGGDIIPSYLHSLDYLTFAELGTIFLKLIKNVFSGADEKNEKILISRWQEYIAKLGRLRNCVAHLRNIDFQDMEDLISIVERMRNDIVEYVNWR